MTILICPHCAASIPSEQRWAQVAVATLIAAPAVPDMASQVRCPACGRVSAASDFLAAADPRLDRWRRSLGVLAVVAALCAVVALLSR